MNLNPPNPLNLPNLPNLQDSAHAGNPQATVNELNLQDSARAEKSQATANEPNRPGTLLVTLNSKFVHTSLALRCLRESCPAGTELLEGTVNQPKDEILRQILSYPAKVYAFSVYIFNVTLIRQILSDLRAIRPDALILCGGPEVSFGCEEFLRNNPAVDGILRGEGEETFRELMEGLVGAPDPRSTFFSLSCDGVSLLLDGQYVAFPDRAPLCDLDRLPFPYRPGELETLQKRILYYESSRGCPYTCIYCLSSVQGRVRFRSPQQVFSDLQKFLDAQVRLVKFVDRTFNCDRLRARALWQYLKDHDNGVTSFHFEIAAWLLEEEDLELLESCRPGMILLEVGVQSANPETLRAITRRGDQERLYQQVRRLSQGPCHVHTDLISGLPYEDLNSFEASFNTVFALRSQCLQLGFLKRLKGTALEQRDDGAVYSEFPPYEILRNQWLSPGDLQVLKGVEKVLDRYWNSGLCTHLLSYLIDIFPNGMFSFFRGLAESLEETGEFYLSHSTPRIFEQMASYLDKTLEGHLHATAKALLCYDLFTMDRCHSPAPWQSVLPDREELLALLKSGKVLDRLTEEQRKIYLRMTPVQWLRNGDLAIFPCGPDGTLGRQKRLFLYGPLRISILIED